jgi:hypothetical protein
MKHILLRETMILRVQGNVSLLENLYWKYAVVVIDRLQFGRPITTDDIQHMVGSIHLKQEELSVAIAHLRSLSIDVVESVLK